MIELYVSAGRTPVFVTTHGAVAEAAGARSTTAVAVIAVEPAVSSARITGFIVLGPPRFREIAPRSNAQISAGAKTMPGRRYTAAGAAEPDTDRDRARAGGFVGRLGLEPRTRR